MQDLDAEALSCDGIDSAVGCSVRPYAVHALPVDLKALKL